MNKYKHFYYKETGAVLIAGLLLLLIITMLSITSMQSVSLSEKMTNNFRDSGIAFHAAESALLDGEQWIFNQLQRPKAVTSCQTPPCDIWKKNMLGDLKSHSLAWWQNNGRFLSSTLPGVSSQPNFIVEEVNFIPHELSPNNTTQGIAYYRITARGTGSVDNSIVIMQSVYAKSFN